MKPKRKLWVRSLSAFPREFYIHNKSRTFAHWVCKVLFTRYVGPLKRGETRELIIKLGKVKK
jgi:hypothetical protein